MTTGGGAGVGGGVVGSSMTTGDGITMGSGVITGVGSTGVGSVMNGSGARLGLASPSKELSDGGTVAVSFAVVDTGVGAGGSGCCT